jgi:hypothetical protein
LDTLLCIERYQRNLSTPGYELYHIPSGTYSFFPCAEWDSVDTFWQQGVSHDGRFVALDVTYKGGYRFNSMHSLSIFDRWTRRMKKVLPAQAFMNWYYPSWTRRGTLIVSFACRLDSSYTIWEIDTNGVFLRQLTGRDMQQQTADVELPSHLTEFSIHSLHPQPGTGTITVEYDVRRAGVYSLKLIDLRGRQARSIRDVLWHEAGRYIASLRTDALAPGMYLLRLSDRNDRAVYQKVLIDR